MVPDANSDGVTRRSDSAADIGRYELYELIRRAVRDAILGVIGTLMLVGLGITLMWFGVMVAVSSRPVGWPSVIGGVFVALVGFYIAAAELDVIPSVGDIL